VTTKDKAKAKASLRRRALELEAARHRLDAALLDALAAGATSRELCELLDMTHATFWRRVKAARDAAGKDQI
jgi:hypothetical protein